MSILELEIDDCTLDVVRQGKGAPLLLVHGSLSDARTWQSHTDILSESFDVIVPTQRYFGFRPWPDDGASFGSSRHAADLIRLIEHLKLENISCVGWSYGGNVALHAALMNPNLFKNLYLYEPAAAGLLSNKTHIELALADRDKMLSPTLELLKTEPLAAVVETFLDDAAGKDNAFRSMPEFAQQASLDNASMFNLMLNMKPFDLSLSDFSVPTTIGCGQDTRVFYKTIANGLQEQCDRISVRWIPEAHHLWPVMNIDAFCKQIVEP